MCVCVFIYIHRGYVYMCVYISTEDMCIYIHTSIICVCVYTYIDDIYIKVEALRLNNFPRSHS